MKPGFALGNLNLRLAPDTLNSHGMATTSAPSVKPRARYIMIGGFLGAGKTTAVARLAQRLTAEGSRVGLITNDQGSNLVDTATLRARGFATEEIPGGCFCCRFSSLVDAADKLTESTSPDVFIAEPVGSCTDLVATVSYPLRRMYGEAFSIAPLSVLVDPIRARSILGLDSAKKFSDKVLYIYRKQLEEADIIVINKTDVLNGASVEELRVALLEAFPGKQIFAISARNGTGLDAWFSAITSADQSGGQAMPVDYALYGEGEALLGWLNCTLKVSAVKEFDANAVLRTLAELVHRRLTQHAAEVAHLKITLSPEPNELGEIGVINLVRNDFVPELAQELSEPVERAEVILNLRAEAPPELLCSLVTEALAETEERHPTLFVRVQHLEHFRPGQPKPTHRLATAV